MPQYVKEAAAAELCSKEAYAEAPSSVFANVVSRMFPGDSKAATWLSWAHFLDKRAEMHPKIARWTEERLTKFARLHGIAGDVEAMRQKRAEACKDGYEDLPDSMFALVTLNDNGQRERHYPLRNAAETTKAAEWLAAYREHFDFEDRNQIAENILEKAAQYGAALPEETRQTLERHAGRGLGDPREIAGMIRNRCKAATVNMSTEIREGLEKLASAVADNPKLATEPTVMLELCRTVDRFDQNVKFAGRYTDSLPMPEDVVFKHSVRATSTLVKNAVALTNGAVFEVPQFGHLRPEDIQDFLGNDIARAVTNGLTQINAEKMATAASVLSVPEADVLEGLLLDCGQRPLVKQSAVGPKFSRDEAARIMS